MTVITDWNKHWQEKEINESEVEDGRRFSEARIIPLLKREFGSLAGLKTIEIGSGMGTDSLILAMHGIRTTLLDYSDAALTKAEILFDLYIDQYRFKAKMIKADVFSFNDSLKGRFDVAMSFGLAEHFEGAERIEIFKAHLDLIRSGGVIIVSVPNRFCPSYRAVKVVKQWDEIPFSKRELRDICEGLDVEIISLFGTGFSSFHDQIVNTILGKDYVKFPNVPYFIDDLLGYALVLVGRKV